MTHPPQLRDAADLRPIVASEVVFHGRVWDVRRETVELADGVQVVREFVDHPGAVAILAMDADDQVVLIQQYRHPVRRLEWELPAGLLDVAGEPPQVTAARELYEEADLYADRWHRLTRFASSPGGINEELQIFLARDLREVPAAQRHHRSDEEAGMPIVRVPLDELLQAIDRGAVGNATLIIAALLAARYRASGWPALEV